MRGLIRFARTGAVTHELKKRLRSHARSPSSPLRPQAARLLQYAVARGADSGPVGDDFGAVCDQIDRADAMLEELRNRVQQAHAAPEQPRRGPQRPAPHRHGPPRPRQPDRQPPPRRRPPPTPPSTPSPPRPPTAKPAPAKSSTTASTSPKTPTADATAKPSPPAKHESPPACAPSNAPTAPPSTPKPPQHPNSPKYSPLPTEHPIMNWNWSNTLGTRR